MELYDIVNELKKENTELKQENIQIKEIKAELKYRMTRDVIFLQIYC